MFNGTNSSLQANDVLRGGGGRDTLNYTDSSVGGTSLPVADIAGIEVINIRNVSTASAGTPGTAEVVTITFDTINAGEFIIIGGVTYEEGVDGDTSAAAQAQYFADNPPAGFTVTSSTSTTVTLTADDVGNQPNLANTGDGQIGDIAITNGTDAVPGTAAANTFSAANLVGAEEFNTVNSTGAVAITDLAAGQSLGMVGNGSTTVGALTGTYRDTVTSMILNLKDGLQTAATPVGAGAVTINGAGIATATINSSGAANAVAGVVFGGNAVTTLNINAQTAFNTAAAGTISGFNAASTAATIKVTGAGAVRVNTLDAAVDIYDASGASGAQTLTLGAATQVVTGGSGNDVISTGGIVLTTGSVNAGTGTGDRLIVTASADVATLALGAKYSGFEQIQVQNAQQVDLDLLAANNTIDTVRINNAAGTAQVDNLSATQAANVQVIGAAVGLITLNVKDAADPGQVDTVKISATTTTAAGAVQAVDLTGIVLAGVEKLEISGTGTVAATAGAITLTTAGATTLDSIKLTTAGNGNTITIAAGHTASNLVIDASGSSGRSTIDASDYATATGVQIKGGTSADVIIGSALVDVLTGGGGRDTFDFNDTSTTGSVDRITDFGLVTTAVTDVAAFTTQNFRTSGGGANADLIDLGEAAVRAAAVNTPVDVAAAAGNATLDIKATLSARSLISLSGADAAQIDTVAEWLAVARTAGLGIGAGEVAAFLFGGNTYIFQENGATDNLIRLDGVSATGVSIIGAAGTALVGEVFVI